MTAPLWVRVYEMVGFLTHLADAAPDDVRKIREAGSRIVELGREMMAYGGRTDA